MDVSIVIACYNESQHLEASVETIKNIMDSTRWSYELIFIDDLSNDGTQDVLRKLMVKYPKWKYYFHDVNIGRGATVTEGFLKSGGSVVGFIDIDLEVPAYIMPALIVEIIHGRYHVATAKRDYRIHLQIIHRWLISRSYNLMVKKMLGVNLEDTETGCKFFYREKLLPILLYTEDKRWFWDTEIMVNCYMENLKIKELPALFIRRLDKKSTVNLSLDIKDYFIRIINFRKKLKKVYKEQRRHGIRHL